MIVHVIHDSKKELNQFLNQSCEVVIWSSIYAETKQKGISQAHKQIVSYAKENNLKEILICENDVKFTHENALAQFLKDKPKEFSIYLAGASSIRFNEKITQFTGLHCYMIHNSFYDQFLNADENHHIDYAINGKGRFIIHDPMLAIQEGKHLEKYWIKVTKNLNFWNKEKSCIFG